ncbi:alpha/beta fold hydrolase [Rhizomonospora bruguierae]|uniref:alpha/beta fold hydrolase n=1 Tax=Rhizomonospora bruguierae TaxID=1581705 RepID=UPI001BCF7249|nr:alpha/beta fold hydrolase [Micromonospora sp. NBRC 107566]
MTDVSTQYVAGPAGSIAYGRRGAGAPVVLLHPLALAGQVWDGLAERLADRYDVITPDARGHGASEWDGAPFSIDDMADDVVALLDGLGFERAHVVGMSMGGSVAISLAARHPGRVDRLLLADTTAWYGEQAAATWNERADRVLATTRADQIPFQVDRWFTDAFRRTHPERVREAVAVFLATNSAAHAQACRAMGAMDNREVLPRIAAPTLAVAGEEDYATPPSMGEYAAEHVADGRALTLAGLRHLSLIERPELDGLVAAHLEGRELPEAPASSCGCATATEPKEAAR